MLRKILFYLFILFINFFCRNQNQALKSWFSRAWAEPAVGSSYRTDRGGVVGMQALGDLVFCRGIRRNSHP